MTTHIDDQYMTVTESEGVLLLSWKEQTRSMTDEIFKQEAQKFIVVVRESTPARIMVDMRKYLYTLGEALVEWRNTHVIPVYNELQVKQFAFISDTDTVSQDNPNNTFVTRTFSVEDDAYTWLKQEQE